jgi:hypothetical protein
MGGAEERLGLRVRTLAAPSCADGGPNGEFGRNLLVREANSVRAARPFAKPRSFTATFGIAVGVLGARPSGERPSAKCSIADSVGYV